MESKETEKKFYYTFGTNPCFPFEGGWVEVLAVNRVEANAIFRHIFPDAIKGFINCAFCYDENEFDESKMAKTGNLGNFCQRKLGIDDKLRELGASDGDTVRILDLEFEFQDND